MMASAEIDVDRATWLLRVVEPLVRALDERFERNGAPGGVRALTKEMVCAALDAVDVRAAMERDILAGVELLKVAAERGGEVSTLQTRWRSRACVQCHTCG